MIKNGKANVKPFLLLGGLGLVDPGPTPGFRVLPPTAEPNLVAEFQKTSVRFDMSTQNISASDYETKLVRKVLEFRDRF